MLATEQILVLCPEARLQVGVTRDGETPPFPVCDHSWHRSAYVPVPIVVIQEIMGTDHDLCTAVEAVRTEIGVKLARLRITVDPHTYSPDDPIT